MSKKKNFTDEEKQKIYDYLQNHKYRETAEKFGINISRVVAIEKKIEENKQRTEEIHIERNISTKEKLKIAENAPHHGYSQTSKQNGIPEDIIHQWKDNEKNLLENLSREENAEKLIPIGLPKETIEKLPNEEEKVPYEKPSEVKPQKIMYISEDLNKMLKKLQEKANEDLENDLSPLKLALEIRDINSQIVASKRILEEKFKQISELELIFKETEEKLQKLLPNSEKQIPEIVPSKQKITEENKFEDVKIAPQKPAQEIPQNLSANLPITANTNFVYTLSKNLLQIYDIDKRTMHPHHVKIARRHYIVTSVKLQNKIYLSGGKSKNLPPIADTECLILSNDLSQVEYRKLSDMKNARFYHTLVIIKSSQILCIGGYGINPKRHNSVREIKGCELYTIDKNLWGNAPDLEQKKIGASACNFAEKFVYVFGSKGQHEKSIERLDYTAPEEQWKWKHIPVKHAINEIRQIAFCNFVQIGNGEILFLCRNCYSYKYSTKNNHINAKAEIKDVNPRNEIHFKETEPILYKDNVYVWDKCIKTIFSYSVKENQWKVRYNEKRLPKTKCLNKAK